VVDVNGARGAGTPFVHDGVLYRPVQRCSPRYGSAVGIFRVDRLDPDGYAQTEVAVTGEAVGTLMKLLDALDAEDDVQNVYSNEDISDEDMEKYAG
jgi:hypothetical protein